MCCKYADMQTCIRISTHSLYIWICIHIYIHTYIHIIIHTHTHMHAYILIKRLRESRFSRMRGNKLSTNNVCTLCTYAHRLAQHACSCMYVSPYVRAKMHVWTCSARAVTHARCERKYHILFARTHTHTYICTDMYIHTPTVLCMYEAVYPYVLVQSEDTHTHAYTYQQKIPRNIQEIPNKSSVCLQDDRHGRVGVGACGTCAHTMHTYIWIVCLAHSCMHTPYS